MWGRRDGGPVSELADVEWHAEATGAVVDALDSSEDGLSTAEVERRLDADGPNEIVHEERASPFDLFVSQFRDALVYLLVLAALLSLAVGLLPGTDPHYVDAALILLILLANGVFGFVQDYRAERSMAALRELSSPDATVRRNGEKVTVDATQVVPGDLIHLEQGDAVPADARLVTVTNLETDESALTGESTTVAKAADPVPADTPLAERSSMVYMNTTAVRGRATAVVVATGMDTEVGGIATQLTEAEAQETPFQREVNELGRTIGYGVVGLVFLVATIQLLFTDATPLAVLLVGVTLAVAAVPEGLPAVVTLTLALGSQKLLERNALVRRLPVVESLGSVDVIVTDKTGTLTESQMTVSRLWVDGETYDVTGTGVEAEGDFRRDGERVDAARLEPLLRCGAACNNAERAPPTEGTAFYGDPTEVALLVSAEKAGVAPTGDRLREVPFSSDRRRMTVVVDGDAPTAYTKGAPAVVLERCDTVLEDGEAVPLTEERRGAILDRVDAFASDALRVLGFASRPVDDPEASEDELESGLTFLGLQGMIDPPRPEVRDAVDDCRGAGIRVVMATGDNLATATAVGETVGFDSEGAMTGADVDDRSEAELREAVEDVEVFARVAPDHKVRVLRALQANGHTVAMTGDGVNDAPALRNADVGVAMGIRGTDVAQQAADMVLRDDNFVTIRDAIAEGRGIFDNIRKFVNLLLSANTGEVLTVFLGVLVGSFLFPDRFGDEANALILTPVMLLWINLVTDGLPALALGTDPKADDVLEREPRGRDEPVVDARTLTSVLTIGATVTVVGLLLFFLSLWDTADPVRSQTLLFTFFVTVEMLVIQVIRSRFDQPLRSNRWLVAAVALSFGLQLLVLYSPLDRAFGVIPLAATGWARVGVAAAAFLALTLAVERVAERLVG
ncbi:MAG: cation-translocating P-type ATPase [Haloferacaceae archaeon]